MKKLTSQEQQILRKAVNNFNAKVRRLEKQGNSLVDKVSIKEIKVNILKSSDFVRELNKLRRFSKRGVEEESSIKGVSKYELKETKINIGIQKAKLTRKKKQLLTTPFSAGGKYTGYSIGNIKPVEILEIESEYQRLENFFNNKEDYEIKKNINKLKYKTLAISNYNKLTTFKENYLYAMQETYRNYEGFDELWKKLTKLDSNTLYNLAIRDDLLLDFLVFYENDVYSGEATFKRFKDIWDLQINDKFK